MGGIAKLKVTRFEGRTVWEVDFFVVAGDFLLKLLAHRRKDQLDVEEILKIAKVDVAYLRLWADRLGVRDRLEPFLTSA